MFGSRRLLRKVDVEGFELGLLLIPIGSLLLFLVFLLFDLGEGFLDILDFCSPKQQISGVDVFYMDFVLLNVLVFESLVLFLFHFEFSLLL